MTQVISHWEYTSLKDRLLRRKTIVHYIPEEGVTMKYRVLKNGNLLVVGAKYDKD